MRTHKNDTLAVLPQLRYLAVAHQSSIVLATASPLGKLANAQHLTDEDDDASLQPSSGALRHLPRGEGTSFQIAELFKQFYIMPDTARPPAIHSPEVSINHINRTQKAKNGQEHEQSES